MDTRKGVIERVGAELPMVQTMQSPSESLQTTYTSREAQGLLKKPPVLDPSITQVFLPVELNEREAIRQLANQKMVGLNLISSQLTYKPMILGRATVRLFERKRKIDKVSEKLMIAPSPEDIGGVDWAEAETSTIRLDRLLNRPEQFGHTQIPVFTQVPENANSIRDFKRISRELSDWLYYNEHLQIKVHPDLDVFQQPNESERDFFVRLQQAARERRDSDVDKLEEKHSKQLDRLETKIRRLERELAADEAEYDARKREEVVGVGETVLSFFLGRRRTSAATTIARRRRMTSKVKMDIQETKEEIGEVKEDVLQLEGELKEAVNEITEKWDKVQEELVTEEIKPRRSDVKVHLVALAWTPFWQFAYNEGGLPQSMLIPAYK
jgi:hypothetical protein